MSPLISFSIRFANLNYPISIITEAKHRFKLYTSGEDRSAIHPNLRLAVSRIAVEEGGDKEYEAIVKEYHSTTTVDGREICLSALGRVKSPELIQRAIEFLFSDDVKMQDKHRPAMALAANTRARLALWEHIKTHWDTIYKQFSGNMMILDRFVKNTLKVFATQDVLDDIEAFFKHKDNSGYERGLQLVSDSVRGNINWVSRDRQDVADWLKKNVV